MARKESITQKMILDSAFEMTRQEGHAAVTARTLAAKTGCSTQPIFRTYQNMEDLMEAVYERAIDYYHQYNERYQYRDKTPFFQLGMAYIGFAAEEKHLFEFLFLSGRRLSLYEIVNGNDGNIVYEINRARVAGCPNPKDLFMKMWIFIHGAACMTLSGEYDLTRAQTAKLLVETYQAFTGSDESTKS
ncbi:MAG: TetR/AcrR family transcriptional regulator [Clostridium sp.]|jgi:AcrR family transcriptional regulator|nr:TetR/AcrR family transcriptional regulator [Clostridium sp.]